MGKDGNIDLKNLIAQIKSGDNNPQDQKSDPEKVITSEQVKGVDPSKSRPSLKVIKDKKQAKGEPIKKAQPKSKQIEEIEGGIIAAIKAYDNGTGDHQIHLRLDETTSYLTGQLKTIKKLDITKVIGFALQELFKNHPELKELIDNHNKKLQKLMNSNN